MMTITEVRETIEAGIERRENERSEKRTLLLRAWMIASLAAERFGGSKKQYFALSLRQAWAELKGTVKMEASKQVQKIYSMTKEVKGKVYTLEVKADSCCDRNGACELRFRLIGDTKHSANANSTDGMFYADFRNDQIHFFMPQQFDFGKVSGFSLTAEIVASLKADIAAVKAAWAAGFEKAVEKIVSGETTIEYTIVGCDFEHYQAWVSRDTLGKETYDAQKLMTAAVKAVLKSANVDDYMGDVCSLLGKDAPYNPCFEGDLPAWATVTKLCKDSKHTNFKPEIVAAFEGKLSEILAPSIARRKAEAEKNAAQKIADDAQFENEIMFFDGALLSRTGFCALHSLAVQRDKDGLLHVYTPTSASAIKDANTTYVIREQLKAAGCKFDAAEKDWTIADTAENREKILALVRKHDTKVRPSTLGLRQCWECGRWVKASQLDESGYCGC